MGNTDTDAFARETSGVDRLRPQTPAHGPLEVPGCTNARLSESGPIVVVGPCASGKTTLVNELRRLGYDARVVAQEHSEIRDLWRHPGPSLVIALDADLETIRRRRGKTNWPEFLYQTQQRRLESAARVAATRLDTSSLSPMAVLAAAAGAIRQAGIRPRLRETESHSGR
jgi:energy-coupling factor transporter ATP-binding protein EcfA2